MSSNVPFTTQSNADASKCLKRKRGEQKNILVSRGATSSSFRGGNFHEISFDDVIVLMRGTNFSQTVTYNNNVFLPADTKSIVYKHTHSAQRRTTLKTDETERFTTALEAESPVSSEISDLRNFCLHGICTEQTFNKLNTLRKLMITAQDLVFRYVSRVRVYVTVRKRKIIEV